MNSNTADSTSIAPWYRQAWPWFLIALPGTAVVASITSAVLAIRSDDGVVASDYYKQGMEINRTLGRIDRAAALGLQGAVSVHGVNAGDAVSLRLTGATRLPPEASVTVRLVHPGRSGADRRAVLALRSASDDGRSAEFVGAWGDAAPVKGEVSWRLVLDGRDWRIEGDASLLPTRGRVTVGAQASGALRPVAD
jgi:hypothetical protein